MLGEPKNKTKQSKLTYMLSVLKRVLTSPCYCFSVRIMGVMVTVYLVLKAVLRVTEISVCKVLGAFLMKSTTSILGIFVVHRQQNGR